MFALYLILLAIKTSCIYAWDSQQMEVFDLVEEMNNINFYQFLGVPEVSVYAFFSNFVLILIFSLGTLKHDDNEVFHF